MVSSPQTPKQSVSYRDITSDHAGQRIDNYLLNILKGVPKSYVYKLLRSGQVRVNGGRKKPSYKLALDDNVRIPPVRTSEKDVVDIPSTIVSKLLDSKLYEDDDLVIINKPSGIPVHSGSGYTFGVIEALRSAYGEQFIELAHRLDRETSGCLLMAKNRITLTKVNTLFSEGETADIQKHYVCLVEGTWPEHIKTISSPLVKRIRGDEHMVEVATDDDKDASTAISHFECEQRFQTPLASLMHVRLETGRTHQIRVHATQQGHPIAGDTKYGSKPFNKTMKQLGLKRLFLHARRLNIQLDKTITAVAPLDDELSAVLENLD